MMGRPRRVAAGRPMNRVLQGSNQIELSVAPWKMASWRRAVEYGVVRTPRSLAGFPETSLPDPGADCAQLTD
jgi:hypothetical protein